MKILSSLQMKKLQELKEDFLADANDQDQWDRGYAQALENIFDIIYKWDGRKND